MKSSLIIYWIRRDLRLHDNPALTAALVYAKNTGKPFLPLFIIEDYMTADDPCEQFGYPSRWFLAQALPIFAKQFTQCALVWGKAVEYIPTLNNHFALTVFVNDDVHPVFYQQMEKLKAAGVNINVHDETLTIPRDIKTGTGNFYSIFSPFRNACWRDFVSAGIIEKANVTKIKYVSPEIVATLPNSIQPTSVAIDAVFSTNRLLRVGTHIIDLTAQTPIPTLTDWYASEAQALLIFKKFLESGALDDYDTGRNSLELDADYTGASDSSPTSRMSVALAWGLVSARTLLAMIKKHYGEKFDNQTSNRVSKGALTYIAELLWREFYRYQLLHRPELLQQEFQERFRGTIAWVEDSAALSRFMSWIKGETGYPIVDAAMHQLAMLGWMHNRARMIVASVLTKNLGVDWRWGQEYFRATLIDLDEASNNGGWQWGASVGTDPKPIRIFNPELQAKNYDASGAYRARWLPQSYEQLPIIEHKIAREKALRRYGLSKN